MSGLITARPASMAAVHHQPVTPAAVQRLAVVNPQPQLGPVRQLVPGLGAPTATRTRDLRLRRRPVIARERISLCRYPARCTRINAGQEPVRAILAAVPPCAGECRFVRVVPVLIFPRGTGCVGLVLPWLMPAWPGPRSPGQPWPGLLQVACQCQEGLSRHQSPKVTAGRAPRTRGGRRTPIISLTSLGLADSSGARRSSITAPLAIGLATGRL